MELAAKCKGLVSLGAQVSVLFLYFRDKFKEVARLEPMGLPTIEPRHVRGDGGLPHSDSPPMA